LIEGGSLSVKFLGPLQLFIKAKESNLIPIKDAKPSGLLGLMDKISQRPKEALE